MIDHWMDRCPKYICNINESPSVRPSVPSGTPPYECPRNETTVYMTSKCVYYFNTSMTSDVCIYASPVLASRWFAKTFGVYTSLVLTSRWFAKTFGVYTSMVLISRWFAKTYDVYTSLVLISRWFA